MSMDVATPAARVGDVETLGWRWTAAGAEEQCSGSTEAAVAVVVAARIGEFAAGEIEPAGSAAGPAETDHAHDRPIWPDSRNSFTK